MNDRDSDSLEYEAKAFPETVRVLTGRFDRNPPQFYEVRLRRVAQEIAASPEDLALYDDAAVACDRLGRDDEAIVWIEKKRARLGTVSPDNPRFRDAWYRYYANVGTFRAHRWLRAGANRAQINELQQAQFEIAKAVELKPDAHLGREWAQQWVMAWLIDPGSKSLGQYLDEKRGYRSSAEVVQALAGLVVLGNAWESVDITGAIGYLLRENWDHKLALVAKLRCMELLRSGKRSLSPAYAQDGASLENIAHRLIIDYPRGITNKENVERKYQELRAEAESYQRLRTAYAVTRLNAGQHPDTDPRFWNDFHPAPAPSLAIPWSKEVSENFGNWLTQSFSLIAFYVFLAMPVVLILFVIVRRINARRWERNRDQIFRS